MTAASTLPGDSLGGEVWLLTRPTRVAAPTAPPTTIVAKTVAKDASKWTP